MNARWFAKVAFTVTALFCWSAAAEEGPSATFALILGVNQAIDTDVRDLRYADDDAAQYLQLFRALGARTYLLTRPDENTARLHPQAVAEALLPRKRELDDTLVRLAADVHQAHLRKVRTVFYFIYAGHGNVRHGRGYISLEDERLFGADLGPRMLDRIAADESHLIIDACYSFFLTYGRGAGGTRRPLSGFTQFAGLSDRKDVGLLLSTSSARESHEWEAFGAGVFSHEVRSGLYGAADADGDGQVSYREIAAFVSRANEAIPNERFRPDIYAKPPTGAQTLVDLRPGMNRRIEIDGDLSGHYQMESSQGVRLAEFNSASGQVVQLMRPGSGLVYLYRVDDEREYVVPPSQDPTLLASLEAGAPRTRMRGAIHDAFGTIFSLSFEKQTVAQFKLRAPPAFDHSIERTWKIRSGLGYASLALALGSLTTAITLSATTPSLRDLPSGSSQADLFSRNDQIHQRDLSSAVLYGVAGATALTGALLLFLPERFHRKLQGAF